MEKFAALIIFWKTVLPVDYYMYVASVWVTWECLYHYIFKSLENLYCIIIARGSQYKWLPITDWLLKK